MENKETSIDWLFLMLNNPNRNQEFSKKLLDKAKEMHEQEIINAAQWMPKPYDNIEFLPELAKQYYKETYEK